MTTESGAGERTDEELRAMIDDWYEIDAIWEDSKRATPAADEREADK